MPEDMEKTAYHHGDLKEALISAALETIAGDGPGAVSLRQLARTTGVSHGAPAHHFGDRTGLFTAIATRGFERLHDYLARAVGDSKAAPHARLNASGKAYVLFAADNPAYFEVMFRPDLLHRDDPALKAAAARAGEILNSAIADARPQVRESEAELRLAALRAWTHAHGLATLWVNGNLNEEMAPDGIEALADQMFAIRRDC